jgi:hypothetical protein
MLIESRHSMSDPEFMPPSESTLLQPEPSPPVPAQPSFAHNIFKGPHGMRAGWRLLLYLLIAAAIGFGLGFILQPWLAHSARRLWVQVVSEGMVVIAAIVPAFVMARIEKRPVGAYGLPGRQAFGKLFWVGCVWGLFSITALLAAIRGLHGFYFGHIALHGIRVLKFAVFWAVFFLLVAFFEEFLLRGYTQFTLTEGIGFWPAAAILSAIFGALHEGNPGEAWRGLLSAALIGFFLCLTLRRTGNLWFAVGFHQAFDWGETFLYSVPNSGTVEPGHLLNSSFHGPIWLTGGSVGPEGSVFVFILIAAMWALFDRIYPEAKYAVPAPAANTQSQPGDLRRAT